MAHPASVSAVDVADLLLFAAARARSPAVVVEPTDGEYRVRLLGPGAAEVRLSHALGEAVAVRLAFLAGLDPFAVANGLGRIRLRAAAFEADLVAEAEPTHDGLKVGLRALPPLAGLELSQEIRTGLALTTGAGRYVLEDELGRGGMGIVWRARHVETGRTVAVKVLNAEVAQDPKLGAQLGKEGRAASLANHPGIVNVTDFGTSPNGRSFLVMELVQAATLEAVLEKGALSVRRSLLLARRIANALQAAHIRGVIHHDLKPSNVFVDDHDTVKIGDFGAARVLWGSTGGTLSQTGLVLGTPYYMSPERARGKDADERSDLYSLGCILFQMIAGRAPYDSESLMEVLLGHVSGPIPDLKSPFGPVPESVEAVVTRALAKSPADRYANAGEMDATIQKVLSTLAAEGVL